MSFSDSTWTATSKSTKTTTNYVLALDQDVLIMSYYFVAGVDISASFDGPDDLLDFRRFNFILKLRRLRRSKMEAPRTRSTLRKNGVK